MCQIITVSLCFISLSGAVSGFGTDYFVLLTSNGPVVQGAEITFTAKLYTTSGDVPTESFEYYWEDNALHYHKRQITTDTAEDKWSLSYPANLYPPGPYEMQVKVSRCFIFCSVTSQRIEFNITGKLNGQMSLVQGSTLRPAEFVSNATVVTHEIVLSPPDYLYLKDNATSILTYWFIDCVYYGMTPNFTFSYKYDKPETQHTVEALVVAGFEPITTPAPTTTTTTTTTPKTTTTTSTTTKPTTTTLKPNTTTTHKPNQTGTELNVTTLPAASNHSFPSPLSSQNNSIAHRKRKREVGNTTTNMLNITGLSTGENVSFPSVCINQTNIAPDPAKVYGYFSKILQVKAPVSNISVTGNNWLQHGDMLSLGVKCTGSHSFNYCYNFMMGLHNVTTNETCDTDPDLTDICEFTISRYYKSPGEYTVVIIVKNDVSKVVYPVTVNVYKVTKRPQLSVIVVPVSFSLVAVVLIVFGMAYYIQNRRRFTVEVADFDFGQTYSDMEYKTFRERLRDSITNALTRTPTSDQSEPTVWPSSSRKYGSMT